MEARLLGWALLVGALVSSGMADNHGGGHSMPDNCDQSAVQQCFSPFMPSGVLEVFASDNQTAMQEAGERVYSHPTYWGQVCGALETAVGCLGPQEKLCFNDSSDNFTELFHLNYTVPTIQYIRPLWASLCTNDVYCISELQNCTSVHKDIKDILDREPDLTDADTCRQVKDFEMCVSDHMPRECRASSHVIEAVHGLQMASDYCGELKCSSLTTCKLAMGMAQPPPKENGLDANTCSLYRNYVSCAGNVQSSSSCTDLPFLHGVNLTEVSNVVDDACTAMDEEGINAIYTCDAFTKCQGHMSPPSDSLFTPHICPMVQGVLGCALKAVRDCAGVNATKRPQFISAVTGLAHRAQALGCRAAQVMAEECPAFESCTMTPYMDPMSSCRSFAAYQSCLGNASDSCNLTVPRAPPSGPHSGRPRPAPRLQDISALTQAMCTALEPIMGCEEYDNCTGDSGKVEEAEKPWQLINGLTWCHHGVRAMECAMFFTRTCNTTSAIMDSVSDIYGRMLDLGCENTYMYVRPVPPTTSGSARLVAVSMMTLLVAIFLTLL